MSGKPLENYNSEDPFRELRGNSDVLRTLGAAGEARPARRGRRGAAGEATQVDKG